MKSASKFKAILVTGCSMIGLLAGSAAYAQQAAGSGQIEEVTVTAQRRTEDVQKVPISVVAITPDTALDAGALRTDQLAETVPGMQMGHEINSATTFIRGVGPNSNGTGEESSVAVYLDDLYIEDGDASIFNLNGISGIDVLKGPQGTLFGRNSTGGVIQVRTKDPSFDDSADFDVGYANYNTFSGDAYLTGGITDNLAANLTIYGSDQEQGWGKDVTTGQQAFTEEDWGVRSKWLWTPTSSTRVLLSGTFMYTRGEEGLGFNQVPGFVAAGGQGYFPGESGTDAVPQSPTAPFQCSTTPTPCPPGAKYVGFYNTADNINDQAVNKHALVELRVDQDLGFAKLVSITGWQDATGYARFAQDGSVYGDIDTLLNQADRNFSQELQILNPDNASYASWLTWIVGGFYMEDNAGYPGAQLAGIAEGFPVGVVPSDWYLRLTDNVRTTSWAAYAQATAEILPDTHFTLGGRYTADTRLFTGGVWVSPAVPGIGGLPACDIAPVACPTTAATPGSSKTWPMDTFRIALDHEFTDDIMAYISYNRGEKSGQFDTFGTAAGGPINNPPVNPEILKSVEAGLKSEWLDHHLQINLSAFHYDISNLQMAIIVGGGTKLINAASATVNGGELSATFIPIDNLTLTSGLSILYGSYGSFPYAPDYFPPNAYFNGSNYGGACPPSPTPKPLSCNAAGADMIRAPHFSGNLSADYVIPSSVGDFDLNVNWAYTDSYYEFPDGSLGQPATNLINASVKWSNPSGRYDIRLWGANLSGDEYYSFASESVGYGQQFSPAPPRTYGITLSAHL